MYIVIMGGGKVGAYLASVMLSSENEVALIEQSAENADLLSVAYEGQFLVINGDGCDSRFQEDAGIRRADVFVSATGQENLRIFREVGIECVSSTTLIANLIEEEALLGSVSVVSSLTHGNVSLSEFTVGRMKHHSEDEGVAIADIEMPDGALIVAVAYEDDAEVARPEMLLYPGDQVIVVADIDVLDEVRAAFRAL